MATLSTKYNDPEWSAITAQAEKKAGIPAGFLHSIVNNGERSNADQVSEKGAKTPYQIIPSTAKLIKNKYGIDPYLSPENSALGAALLLKESLDRNNGDIALAAAEYHGGTDRANWGRKTKAYVNRVMSGMQESPQPDPNAPTIEDGTGGAAVSEPSIEAIHAAYKAGKFTPEQKAEYEADLASGVLPPPVDEVATETTTEAVELPENIAEAYASGKMDRQQMRDLEADVAKGVVKMPRGYGAKETGRGIVGGTVEAVTGKERSTDSTRAVPDIGMMPTGVGLLDAPSIDQFKLSVGMLGGSPEEKKNMLLKSGLAKSARQDENGNWLLTSSVDGKEYAIQPGAQVSDIVGAAPFLATGGSGIVPALYGAGTQAAIEGAQSQEGGSFDTGHIALAGGLPVGVQAVGAVAKPVISAVAPKVMQGVNAVKTMGSRGAQAADVADTAAQSADNVVPPAAIPEPVAPTPAAPVKATAEEVAAIHAPDVVPSAAAEMPAQDFGALARKASEGSRKAQEDLAAVIDINPEAKAAADALGLDLPADLISDSKLLQQSAGLSRGIVGEQSSAWRDTVAQVGNKADEALTAMDGSTDIATLSETVKGNLDGLQKELKDSAGKIYSEVEKQVPASTRVTMPKSQSLVNDMIADVGEKYASPRLKAIAKMAKDKKLTYQALKDLKSEIGEVLGGKVQQNPFGNTDTGKLKRLYAALADDQLDAVENAIGGEAGAALRSDLRYANQLTAKRKGLEKRIVNAFGKEGEGSIASKLMASIKSGAKGDVAGLNKVLKVVPKDMQKETVATGLMNAARTPQGNFSPNAFTNLYKGIRENAPVAKIVFGQFSKEENEMLRHIYTLSKRTRDAENAISKTGKANQPLYDALIAQNAIGTLLDSTGGRMVQQAASAIPSGGAAMDVVGKVVETLTTTPVDRMTALNKLLGSAEFSELLESASKAEAGAVTDKAVKKLAASKVFADFIKSANMPRELTDREKFVAAMLQGGKGGIQENKDKGKF